MFEIDGDDATVGCIQIGLEIQHSTIAFDKRILVLEIIDEFEREPIVFGEVPHDDAIAVIRPDPDGDDQIMPVFGHGQLEAPVGVIGSFVDEDVGGLWSADAVVVDLHVGIE